MEIGTTLNHHNLKSDKQGNLALNLIGEVVLVVSCFQLQWIFVLILKNENFKKWSLAISNAFIGFRNSIKHICDFCGAKVTNFLSVLFVCIKQYKIVLPKIFSTLK